TCSKTNHRQKTEDHVVPPASSLVVPRSEHAPRRRLPPPRPHQDSHPPNPTASQHE
uniref:Uncharacterized protein n=1 Tax=Aegilops tauschii subsp. strangulata TaxID=200361 RepID=A0A453CTS2_AEGTS